LVKAQSNSITVKSAGASGSATRGGGESAAAQVGGAHKSKDRRKSKAALSASRHPAAATRGRARSVAHQDTVRDHVLAGLKGNLRAQVITDRLADSTPA
jgi:hypothetical protein